MTAPRGHAPKPRTMDAVAEGACIEITRAFWIPMKEEGGRYKPYTPSPLAAHPAHSEPMFHAVTWNHQTKQVQAEQVVTSRGSEFGLLQRPGRDRLQRAVARLGVAFGTLRSQTPREFRADRGHVAPDLEMLFEAKLEEVRCAGLIQPMPLKVSDRHESTAKIFEEIWFSKQMLADKKVLTVLDVTWLQIGVQGMELLVDAVLASNCRKSLTSLLLGHNFIRDDGCRHLQRLLQSNSTITTLLLDNNDISEEGATFLGEALRRNSTLKTVGLSRNSIGHHGMKAVLDGIREAGYMRALNVTDNGFLPETYAMLSAGLTKNVLPLVSLTLSEGPRMVSSMQGNQLASLIGISLSKNTTLTSLNLPHNMIGDAGFQDIADSLPFNTSLVHLNCRGNQITAWGASKIALTFPSNSTLQSLDLSANDIRVTSETKALLESLHGNTSLKDLDLSSNLCHTATEAPVRAILERNNSFYKDQTADMHSFVSDMDQAIDAKQRRLDAAKKQAQHMMAKQQHAAELVRPLLNPPQQEALQVSRSPSTMLSDVGSEDMSRRKQLYPGNPARVYLHVNDPRRCGKGLLVSLPVGATAETLWTMIMDAANRVLPLRGWPARALFLDCSFKWITDDGLQEMLPKGSEIHMWHLPFLQDGMELVVSDGKGDGLSCVKQYYDRNGSTRRNRYKVFQVRHSEHWSVAYWRIFVRFYRYRIALLHRYRTASLTLHADHFRPGRQPPQTPDPRPA